MPWTGPSELSSSEVFCTASTSPWKLLTSSPKLFRASENLSDLVLSAVAFFSKVSLMSRTFSDSFFILDSNSDRFTIMGMTSVGSGGEMLRPFAPEFISLLT